MSVKGGVKGARWGAAKGLWSVAEEPLLPRGALGGVGSAFRGWISFSAALLEAVAVAVHLENVYMVGEPVEQCAREPFGAEQLGPFLEGEIAGHKSRSAFVSLAEGLEEQFGTGLGQRHEAQFIDDENLVAGQKLLEAQKMLFVARSKVSRVLTTGNFACRMRRSVARRSRSSNSSSSVAVGSAGSPPSRRGTAAPPCNDGDMATTKVRVRRTVAEKQRIVELTLLPGASVARVAQAKLKRASLKMHTSTFNAGVYRMRTSKGRKQPKSS